MYYILKTEHHELAGMIDYSGDNWGQDFNQGVPLDESFDDLKITVKLERDPDQLPDYFELDATPIISDKFVQELKHLPMNTYQLYPILIESPQGSRAGYSLLNVVGRIPCVDKRASDYTLYDGEIVRMKKMALVDNIKEERDIFRAEEYPLVIFLSERIAKALASSGLTGMQINPAEGWSDRHRF